MSVEDFGFKQCHSLRSLVKGDRVQVAFPVDALSKEITYKSGVVVHGREEFESQCLIQMDSGALLPVVTPKSLLVQRKRPVRAARGK